MGVTLYSPPVSPAGRAVLITAKAIGLKIEEKRLDDFLNNMNPLRLAPIFKDSDGTMICDSHAANMYIVSKYGKDDSLYPKDLKKRAAVHEKLHLDTVAYATFDQITKHQVTSSDVDEINNIYSHLEAFLNASEWIAGDSLTIADYHFYTTVNALAIFEPINAENYPKVTAWLEKIGSRPEIETERKRIEEYII